MKLNEQQIKHLQDKYLGKRIRVPYSNNTGFGIVRKDDFLVGKCEFIGYNPFFPSWGFQVTISRTPVINVDPSKIQLINED